MLGKFGLIRCILLAVVAVALVAASCRQTPTECAALAIFINVSLPKTQNNPVGKSATVNGFVNKPDATVTVNGTPATVDSDGNFSVPIVLIEGNNIIKAMASLGDQTDVASLTVLVTAAGVQIPPGQGLSDQSQLFLEHDIVVEAGQSAAYSITFESRKSIRGPTEVYYDLNRVRGEYSTDGVPMPDGLRLSVEPTNFTVCPNTTYRSVLRVEASNMLARGEYWFLLRQRLGTSVNSGGSSAWIRLRVY